MLVVTPAGESPTVPADAEPGPPEASDEVAGVAEVVELPPWAQPVLPVKPVSKTSVPQSTDR